MPPKTQMKIDEKNVCKFRSIQNTFSIDENFKKKGGVLVTDHSQYKIQITIHGN